MKIIVCIIILTLAFVARLYAQPPFYNDIQQFKKQDKVHFPPENAVLFIGSSSFTKWTDVQDYFPAHIIINRAFGGSTLPDVIRYADDVIFPYHPKQIIIYCGDNDLASSDTVSPEVVLTRFKTLFNLIRSHYKTVPVVYVSIKPSPSRRKLMPLAKKTNLLIMQFLTGDKNATFVDVYHAMLLPNGEPNGALFIDDSLHMNNSGYVIWQKKMAPYLK